MRDLESPEKALDLDERREGYRKPIYLGEGFRVSVHFHGQQSTHSDLPLIQDEPVQFEGEIIDLAASGLGVAVDPQHLNLIPPPGSLVKISPLIHSREVFSFDAILVNVSRSEFSQREMVRVGFTYFSGKEGPAEDRRRNHRFPTHATIFPSAYCSEALFFQESFCFRIKEVSRTGALLDTQDLDAHFIPNIRLGLDIFIPGQGHFFQKVRVVNYRHEGDIEGTELAVEWHKPPTEFLESLSNYLLYFDLASIRQLREEGFELTETAPLFSVGVPRSTEDWDRILDLRLKAYRAVGKFKDVQSSREMMDIYDSYARHLVCRNKGKIVGCGRISFINHKKERSEHHNMGVTVPEWLWEADFVEVSRLCTEEEYRGGDVLLSLFRHIGKVVYQSGKRYIVSNCNPEMWPTYKRIGFRKTGVVFSAFGRDDCELIVNDCTKGMEGGEMKLLNYNFIFLPVAKYIYSFREAKSLALKLRLFFHALLNPLTNRIVSFLVSRKLKLKKKMKELERGKR